MGQLHRARRRVARGRVRRALVEDHRDVHPEVADLQLRRPFGRQEVRAPVDVAPEEDPVLGELPVRGQRHHLEAAGVRQDRPLPPDEPVEAAHLPDQPAARAEHEVVGVREDDLGAGAGDVAPAGRLDGAGGPDGHEGRRLDAPVVERHPPATGRPVDGQELETQHDATRVGAGGREIAYKPFTGRV